MANVTPPNAYYGRREEILGQKKEQKHATPDRQLQYKRGQAPNLTRDELGSEL